MSDSGRSTRPSASEAGSGAVYALGIIGALVFFCSPAPRLEGGAPRHRLGGTPSGHHHRLWLEIDPTNEASLPVTAQCGYRLERRLPAHRRSSPAPDEAGDAQWHDCLIWSHTAETA